MVGYAVLIVSFPVYMTHWPAAAGVALHSLSLGDAFDLVFAGQSPGSVDAFTAATALDAWKTQAKLGKAASDILAMPAFGQFGARGQEYVSMMYLAGGLLLVAYRLITWHIPVAMLAGIAIPAGTLT